MANNTQTVNQIVSIFRDLALRHEMVNDFFYGPSYNVGASRPMRFPYLAVEQGQAQVLKSLNGYKENIYAFQIYCMDKINKGDDNYDEIISDTKFILDSIISDMSQHKYYVDLNLSLFQDITMEVVVEATDDNVNGWIANVSLKNPVRYTPCNVPIEPISGYTTTLNASITEYRLIGATGPQGPTGPAGEIGPTGPSGEIPFKFDNLNPAVSFLPMTHGLQNSTLAASAVVWYPIEVKQSETISALSWYLNIVNVGNVVFGLYNQNPSTGLPDNLLFQTAPFDFLVVAVNTYTLPTPIVLTPGIYYVAYNSTIAATIRVTPTNVHPNVFSTTNANGSFNRLSKTKTYDGTLPNNFTDLVQPVVKTLTTNPHVIFLI